MGDFAWLIFPCSAHAEAPAEEGDKEEEESEDKGDDAPEEEEEEEEEPEDVSVECRSTNRLVGVADLPLITFSDRTGHPRAMPDHRVCPARKALPALRRQGRGRQGMARRGLRRGALPPHALRRREWFGLSRVLGGLRVDDRRDAHDGSPIPPTCVDRADTPQACAAPKVFKKLA